MRDDYDGRCIDVDKGVRFEAPGSAELDRGIGIADLVEVSASGSLRHAKYTALRSDGE